MNIEMITAVTTETVEGVLTRESGMNVVTSPKYGRIELPYKVSAGETDQLECFRFPAQGKIPGFTQHHSLNSFLETITHFQNGVFLPATINELEVTFGKIYGHKRI